MKIFDWIACIVVFFLLTQRCGKSIEKRDWGESVADFLIALGVVLVMVKNTVPF